MKLHSKIMLKVIYSLIKIEEILKREYKRYATFASIATTSISL